MSHVSTIERDELFCLEDIKNVKTLENGTKIQLIENQKTFEHWRGMRAKCDHAIKATFLNSLKQFESKEMGLRKKGEGYSLEWDSLALSRQLGENAGLFTREYDIQRTQRLGRVNRRRCSEMSHTDVNKLGIETKPDWRYLRIEV